MKVMVQNVVRTSWGIPRVTHQRDFKELKDSFGFLEKHSVALQGRVKAAEITMRLDSSPSPFLLSNRALTLHQWLIIGHCFLPGASGWQMVGPRQVAEHKGWYGGT